MRARQVTGPAKPYLEDCKLLLHSLEKQDLTDHSASCYEYHKTIDSVQGSSSFSHLSGAKEQLTLHVECHISL